MPDKTISNDQQPAGRWKIRCSAGQDPVTGAPIHRATYGQTPQEAADSLNKNHIQRENRAGGR